MNDVIKFLFLVCLGTLALYLLDVPSSNGDILILLKHSLGLGILFLVNQLIKIKKASEK